VASERGFYVLASAVKLESAFRLVIIMAFVLLALNMWSVSHQPSLPFRRPSTNRIGTIVFVVPVDGFSPSRQHYNGRMQYGLGPSPLLHTGFTAPSEFWVDGLS
jgi:hypothetical protein